MTDHDKHAQYQFNLRLLRFNYDQRRRLKEAVSLLRSGSSAALQVQQAIIDLDASIDMLEVWNGGQSPRC